MTIPTNERNCRIGRSGANRWTAELPMRRLGGKCGRNGKQKHTTVVQFTLGANGASVSQDDVLGDRQSEAGPAGFAGTSFVHTVKAFKEPGKMFGRNARTKILNIKLNHV